MSSCENSCLLIPGSNHTLQPGYKVKLGRFDSMVWVVGVGWYSWGGNRHVYGWYLTDTAGVVKPLQLTDLTDIYVIHY